MNANLVNCETCSTSIAISATSCPKCGARNVWMHPTAKAFLASISTMKAPDEFRYTCAGTQINLISHRPNKFDFMGLTMKGMVLIGAGWGVDWLPYSTIVLIASVSLYIIGGLLFAAGVIGLGAEILLPKKFGQVGSTICRIDVSGEQIRFDTDDEAFWAEIIANVGRLHQSNAPKVAA